MFMALFMFVSMCGYMNTHKHKTLCVYTYKHAPSYAFICNYVCVYPQTCAHVYKYMPIII